MDVHVVDHDTTTSIVQVRGAGPTVELFVRTTGEFAPDLSMWVPLVLPVAMRHRLELRVHGPVDETALQGAVRAQKILAEWWPKLQVVEVQAGVAVDSRPAEGVGLAFSAGVDAFHSLKRHFADVSHLWFVHGFDVPLWRTELRATVHAHISQVAEATKKQLVEIVTNCKPWADRHVRWGEIYHGAATAAIAIGHAPMWNRALIASTHVESDLHPWGSHPALDPLWSSGTVTVEHDAIDVDRVEKVKEIAEWSTAMDHLRVCWMNPDQQYNCGTCEKCVRTRINLIAAGASSTALPGDVMVESVGPIRPGESAYQGRTNLRHLQVSGLRPDPQHALKEALEQGRRVARQEMFLSPPRELARRAKRRLAHPTTSL